MSFGYPVMLELAGRRCVVIGAQAIHEGKVEGCSQPARRTS